MSERDTAGIPSAVEIPSTTEIPSTAGTPNTAEIPSTDWAKALGLSAPIVCAPMGGVAGGALAGAVSRAGALGMIGMGSAGSAAALERELSRLDAGGAPFGIGMVDWGIERHPDMLERALAAGAAVISVSFGEWAGPRPAWIDAVRASGALAVTQVCSVEEARQAADAGIDAVIARGLEAGGHGDHRESLRPLLDAVVDAVDLPVLAAGAISGPEDVADVLRRGAAAAWVGTAFSACEEALTDEAARRVLIEATGERTLVSRVYDIALERPWPARFPERLLRTGFVDRWHGREEELAADEAAKAEFRAAAAASDYSVVPIDAGLGVGALTEARPAADVVAELVGRR